MASVSSLINTRGIPKPIIPEPPEVPVTIRTTTIPCSIQVVQRGGVGYIRCVVVQAGGGLILDVHSLIATRSVRVVADVVIAAGFKVILIRICRIAAILICRLGYLIVEAIILAIARGSIGTTIAGGAAIL